MKRFSGRPGALLLAALFTTPGQATWHRQAAAAPFASQGRGTAGSASLPSSQALRTEIESAGSIEALESVLVRHPDQGQLIVPRIEAMALAEIRRDGPGQRFVIPGLEPDEGQPNSVTLESGAAGMRLVTEFPGDIARAMFSDGSVHRYVGRFPFADVLTLFGDGDKDHRLTFAVLDGLGLVYLRGTGRVVVASDGKETTTQLGDDR
jgi:hypothetical protein